MNDALLRLIASRPACAAQHFGDWMVEPRWISNAIAMIESGAMKPDQAAASKASEPDDLFIMDGDVAIVPIEGAMTKGRSSYGGTSTVETRATIRALSQDPEVRGIMLHIESPGGTAAGTAELADDVYAARRFKPVHSFASDLMASAAAFVGLQAERVTINPSGEAGSFGTVAKLTDVSKMYEDSGIKVEVISTGPYKGAFSHGAPITDDHKAYAREIIEAANQAFVAGVQRGRPAMSEKQVRALFYGPEGGKVWPAQRALELGIVDGIESFDQALANLHGQIRSAERARRLGQDADRQRRRMAIAEKSVRMAQIKR